MQQEYIGRQLWKAESPRGGCRETDKRDFPRTTSAPT